MEETFKRFLIGYVSAGHTLTDEAQDELEFLANEYVDSIERQFCFTSNATDLFLYYLREFMSEANQNLFNLSFDEKRYITHLEGWIKRLASIGYYGFDVYKHYEEVMTYINGLNPKERQ